jgi:hypothetical protein
VRVPALLALHVTRPPSVPVQNPYPWRAKLESIDPVDRWSRGPNKHDNDPYHAVGGKTANALFPLAFFTPLVTVIGRVRWKLGEPSPHQQPPNAPTTGCMTNYLGSRVQPSPLYHSGHPRRALLGEVTAPQASPVSPTSLFSCPLKEAIPCVSVG